MSFFPGKANGGESLAANAICSPLGEPLGALLRLRRAAIYALLAPLARIYAHLAPPATSPFRLVRMTVARISPRSSIKSPLLALVMSKGTSGKRARTSKADSDVAVDKPSDFGAPPPVDALHHPRP